MIQSIAEENSDFILTFLDTCRKNMSESVGQTKVFANAANIRRYATFLRRLHLSNFLTSEDSFRRSHNHSRKGAAPSQGLWEAEGIDMINGARLFMADAQCTARARPAGE